VTRVQKPSLGKVLIVGGCGFVGSHIVDILHVECDSSVFILSRNSTEEPDPFPDVQYFEANISSLESILPIF
jgi:sterol-4alpha-carboxylate 3-dehydrogenase (decarboxylating)